MFKKTAILLGSAYFIKSNKVFNSPQPQVSMLLRGQYQNKIRRFSPPEKIFDVFATIYQKGRLYMTLRDLLKAICFYNYSLSDEKDAADFKPEHILRFLGKDKRFQIYDYFILVRFLAFQRQKIEKYFDENKMQQMSCPQFIKFMMDQVCQDYKDYIKKSLLIESRQFKPSAKAYEEKMQLIGKQLFQNYGREFCSKKDLIQFRRNIINELYQFEFLMFPIKNGCIDGVDFARSIVKYVDSGKARRFMKRIKNMQGLEQIKITKQSYVGFHTYMQTNISDLQQYLNKKGAIKTDQFAQLINKFVKKQYKIGTQQLSIITKLLDTDQSGFLEKRQILGVLKNLQYYTTVKSGEQTFIQSMRQDFQKIADKIVRIKQILQE